LTEQVASQTMRAAARTTRPAVRVHRVSKRFVLPHERLETVRERILHPRGRSEAVALHALRDVSFEVPPGEFVAIVGRNGSGKSTLLRCMAGIYTVDSGRVALDGRVAPFIELGVGFHPDLPARENLVTSGVMLGLAAREVRRRTPEVLRFGQLEGFEGLKLRNYSSGMALRLAFSLTIHVDADVLLFDEVIAVGDVGFQERCFERFEQLQAEGRTLVLVTHDMDAVRRLCDRAILLHHGELVADGDPESVTAEYERLNTEAVGPPRTLPGKPPRKADAHRRPAWPDWRRLVTVTARLAAVEFRLKYLDTKLGYFWAVLRPLLTFAVLYLVFTKVANFDAGVPNYALYLLTALVLWMFFLDATTSGVFALVADADLVRKLPVPRAAVPLSVVVRALLDLGMNLIAVVVLAIAVGAPLGVGWLELPLLIALIALLGAGIALLVSSLYVRFRDVDQIWAVLAQLMFYGSPILYAITTLPASARAPVTIANPLAAIFTEMRHAVVDPAAPTAAAMAGGGAWLLVPIAICIACLVVGSVVFGRLAPQAAERL
jgi:ABC-type polysaccharide/polyol phosphate transport system ATPase subunit/ABC-type polysaccharide/polyol phosphate export permease